MRHLSLFSPCGRHKWINRKLLREDFVVEDSVDIKSLMDEAYEGLLMAVVRNAEHVLRPHFPPVILRRCNQRSGTHNFCLLGKDDRNFICIDLVYLSNIPSVYSSSLYCKPTMLRSITMISLNEDTWLQCAQCSNKIATVYFIQRLYLQSDI